MDDNTPNRLSAFFDSTFMKWTGWFVGIGLAAFFYYDGLKAPGLTYYVHPARAAVVRAGQTSAISVLLRGKPIAQDVTAVQVVVWNEGKEIIRHGAILKPLTIRTGNAPIIEAEVRKSTREVMGLELDRSRMRQGEVTLDWKLLEHGDAALIQLIYLGDVEVPVIADAVVEGQKEIRRFTPPVQPETRAPSRGVQVVFVGVMTLLYVALLVTVFRAWARLWRDRATKTRSQLIVNTVAPLVALVAVFVWLMYYWEVFMRPVLPFDL
jgi:hypothetical protein